MLATQIGTDNLPIYIAYLRSSRSMSGSNSFIHHLHNLLYKYGYVSRVVKLWKRLPCSTGIPLWEGCSTLFQHVNLEYLRQLARHYPVVIGFYDDEFADEARALIDEGVSLVVHDYRGVKKVIERVVANHTPAVSIRRSVRDRMVFEGADTQFIAHPYIRSDAPVIEMNSRPHWASCPTRIGYEKNIPLIIEANRLLEPSRQVRLWSVTSDFPARRDLRARFPGWEEFRSTERFADGAILAGRSRYTLDLSVLGRNGSGGSQYCYLEAMDSGSVLVIHRGWILLDDEMREGYNCLAVESREELVEILNGDPSSFLAQLYHGYHETLDQHDSQGLATQYIQWIASTYTRQREVVTV